MTGTGIAIAAVCVLAAGYIGWLFGFKAGFASASDQWSENVKRSCRLVDACEQDAERVRAELAAIKATRSDAARRGAAARKAKAEASQAVVTAYNARFTPTYIDNGEGEE